MKYLGIYHLSMESSQLISYLTNICRSGQGPIVSILGLFKAWLNYFCDGQSKMSIKFFFGGNFGGPDNY
jgi:hypothetical protein